jgi:hypothetical protein
MMQRAAPLRIVGIDLSSAVENYQADHATMLQRRCKNADAVALVKRSARMMPASGLRSSGDGVARRKQSVLPIAAFSDLGSLHFPRSGERDPE